MQQKVSASASWDEISLNIGSTSQEASYKLERKAGNGAYPDVFRRGSKGGGSLSWDRKNITRADI